MKSRIFSIVDRVGVRLDRLGLRISRRALNIRQWAIDHQRNEVVKLTTEVDRRLHKAVTQTITHNVQPRPESSRRK